MIVEEKDRMECLKLAVTLMMPKSSGSKAPELAASVIETAERFHQFVKKDART